MGLRMEKLDDLKQAGLGGPIYRQIADAIAVRIARGDLVPGERLPTQRDLARELDINVTTVTRAFATLQQRGLVESRPGRGTVVADPRAEATRFQTAPSDDSALIDLAVNRPATTGYLDALAGLLPRLPRDRRYPSLKDYHPPEGPLWAREAAAAWLADFIPAAEPSRLFVANGAQHALACIVASICHPGDVMVTDVVTYQGINALCHSRGVEIRGLAMDGDGMLPDAFEDACARLQPRAVFLVPSLHNPTTITLSAARRQIIAKVARHHNVLILEDDVYAPLLEVRPPAFAELEPDLTIYVSGLSKCIAPGLRVGFAVAPRALAADIAAAFRIDCWSVSPLSALIATLLLEDGGAEHIIAGQREELAARQVLVREALGRYDLHAHETATHAWLVLPEPWRSGVFVRACRERGVSVLPAEPFIVGREAAPHAVRINVGAARSREDLRMALQILASLLAGRHSHSLMSA